MGRLGRALLTVISFAPWAACQSSCESTPGPVPSRASEAVPPATAARPGPAVPTMGTNQLAEPVTLLRLDKTAYHTRLVPASDAIYLLTMDGVFRLAPGQEPRETKLDLSDTGVATPSAFIFWSNGWFWLAPKQGGAPGHLAELKERPIFIVSVEERFAWIGPDEQGRHTVYTLRQGKPYALYAMSGTAAAATMVEDRVVFLERAEADRWRLGSVARDGGAPSFTATRKGRYPAMLAAAGDVYYYYWGDKDTSEVWAVSPDLRHERVVASHVTCSPLAVADRVFCVSMEGLFEISPESGLPKLVYPHGAATITTLAVDRNRIVWVRDVGAEKLEVQLLYRNGTP